MSVIFESSGFCPICESEVKFVSESTWLRDFYLCSKCGSIPRERALMEVIKTHLPNWKDAVVHESSPGMRGASVRLARECKGYIPSQFFHDRKPGEMVGAVRCENLEALTFDNESIDLHITQDVMEHVFHPDRAFSEIARTLRPGGMHIFTVPLVNKGRPSRRRASISEAGQITHHLEASYHGNPIGDGKSLVTFDWGYDICEYIFVASGLYTKLIYIDDISKGIRAEYIDVLASHKPIGPINIG